MNLVHFATLCREVKSPEESEMNETIVYHEVTAYPMKCRLYLTQKQKASVDEWLLGLGKAYNMTMYALKTGDHRIMQESKPDKDGNTAWFPDFHKMAGKQWLDELRSQNEHVKHVPSASLSSSVGGLFLNDMKRAWEKQGKLPAENWFDRKDKKGHSVIRWYNNSKPRRSIYFQINAKHIRRTGNVVRLKMPKIGEVRLRGWNMKIALTGDGKTSFLDQVPDKQLGCRIQKDRCGDYYAIISLRNVYRPFQQDTKKHDVGIDVGVRHLLADSDARMYANPKYRQKAEEQLSYYRTRLSSQYGPMNQEFRAKRKEYREWNKAHSEEIDAGILDRKQLLPSRHYLTTQKKLSRLERKITRKREQIQHEYSSAIVRKASFIGLESLNVTDMKRDEQFASLLSDAAMSAQLLKLKYKADWCGVQIQEIGPYYPSSQICSSCGYELTGEERLKPGAKTFKCPSCGYENDSDLNAAKVIKNRARFMYDHGLKPEKTERPKRKRKDSPVFKDDSTVLVHYSEQMRERYKNPYVLIDADGNLLDDAKGEGFTTVQNAKKFWRYRIKQRSEIET